MKKILLFLFVLLLTVPAFGIIAELDSETWPNLDISSIQTILTDTPDGSNPMLCQVYIVLGSAGEPLEGSGGAFEFTMTIGGQTVQPSPQIAIFGTDGRASIWTSQFLVPAGEAVVITVESPNADTADVKAFLYDVFPVIAASGVVSAQLANGVTHGGDTAVFNLKSMTVSNPDGDAVTFQSTGSGGTGLVIEGDGNGDGVMIEGGDGGGGIGVSIHSDLANAVSLSNDTNGYGLSVAGDLGGIFDKDRTIRSQFFTIDATLGTPANIDSGGATIADNLKKLADDNGGLTFDATTDSLNALKGVMLDVPTVSEFNARTLVAANYFLFGTDPVELLDSGGTAGTSAAELAVDIWEHDISAFSDTDLAGGILIWLFNLSEGDEFIDTTTTPWQFVKNKKGTPATEYLRKDLFGVDGSDITSVATVIGKQTEP